MQIALITFDEVSVLFIFHELSYYENEDKIFRHGFDGLLMYSAGKLIALLLFITTCYVVDSWHFA